MYGKTHSIETKQKMSASHKGHPSTNGMLGKKHSEESKKKISDSQKGKVKDEDWRLHLSESMKGKPAPNKGKSKENDSGMAKTSAKLKARYAEWGWKIVDGHRVYFKRKEVTTNDY